MHLYRHKSQSLQKYKHHSDVVWGHYICVIMYPCIFNSIIGSPDFQYATVYSHNVSFCSNYSGIDLFLYLESALVYQHFNDLYALLPL